ncbi:hypothetical protein ACFX2C_044415 [Malus domestica]
MSFNPRSPYVVSKCATHWYTLNYHEAYGMFASNGIVQTRVAAMMGKFCDPEDHPGCGSDQGGIAEQAVFGESVGVEGLRFCQHHHHKKTEKSSKENGWAKCFGSKFQDHVESFSFCLFCLSMGLKAVET